MADVSKRRILVADDDRRLRSMLVMFFEVEGYDVDQAGSAEEAHKQLTGPRYDLVLTDSFNISHATVLEDSKAFIQAAGVTPVVLVTGHPIEREDALAAGFAELLSKPFDLADLQACVESLMT